MGIAILLGKKLPGSSKVSTYGGQSNTNVKAKNPFQLTTTSDTQQQESVNPFSSIPQASKLPPFPVQSGPLFKSSASSNPFVTSSASSFSTAATSGVSLGSRSYAQAVNTGSSNPKDPRRDRLAPAFTSSKLGPESNDSDIQDEQHGSSQNPFAKPSGFKFTNPKLGAQAKMHTGVSRMHRPAPPTTHQYIVTLSVRNIDQQMCTPEILRSHFQQFGEVCDLKCMPRKGMATVSYNDHVSLCLVFLIFIY